MLKITPHTLSASWCQTQALVLLPAGPVRPMRAVFSHGFTANKADVLPWAVRVVEHGIPAIIFDWPGHYLGGLNEVTSFSAFTAHAHELFATAFDQLLGVSGLDAGDQVILGGHSLGALMALKALKLPRFEGYDRLGIGVGIGLNNRVETHLFDTEFYQKTLAVRRQLVSPALDSDVMFPWIRDEKNLIDVRGERVHLIVGEDDMVVGRGGMQNFVQHLEAQGARVTSFEPKRLAHHEPTLAAPHLNAFLKQELAL